MKTTLSLIAVSLIVAAMPIGEANADVPAYLTAACTIPNGMKIGAKTPPQFKKYTGVFVGKYIDTRGGPGLPVTYVISNVSADGTATVFAANNDYPSWRVSRACYTTPGKISNGIMMRKTPSGASLESVFSGDVINITRRSSRNVTTGKLTRVPTPPQWQ